ncbi:MAG: hypothetical protein NZ988_06515 [Thaumarchaeota archaeon]|nr:hypothetical protein [Candidatus Calditenuaceae archaeon]MDW8187672.1 hypothetical protein [Nitrososphaerota archaeon]
MTSLATVVSGGILLITLSIASFSVITTITEHYRNLISAIDELREDGRLLGTSMARNSTHILVTMRYEGRDGIPFSQLRQADLVLRYFSHSGRTSVIVLRNGSGWEIAAVGLNGRQEVRNPISLSAGTGILDPWEEVTLSLRVPPDMDLTAPISVELFFPNGVTGVMAG